MGEDTLELLSADERARAKRLVDERTRLLWMRSRGVLRALLGRYLQTDASAICFATGAHGKPALSKLEPNEGLSTAISFNLSHSDTVALYALASHGAVGVDVEYAHRRSIDAVALAGRMFGVAEAERLRALDPLSREREFLRAWVRHEAELKCLGVGIGGADSPARPERQPWIAQLPMETNWAAAVATIAEPRELRCWEWPPSAA